jgi:hypothetical protein
MLDRLNRQFESDQPGSVQVRTADGMYVCSRGATSVGQREVDHRFAATRSMGIKSGPRGGGGLAGQAGSRKPESSRSHVDRKKSLCMFMARKRGGEFVSRSARRKDNMYSERKISKTRYYWISEGNQEGRGNTLRLGQSAKPNRWGSR